MGEKYDSSRFAEVWDRVSHTDNVGVKNKTSSQNDHEKDDIAALCEIIDRESVRIRCCDAAIGKCRNALCRKMIMKIANDTRMHLQKLQSMHYILTGDTHIHNGTCSQKDTLLGTLRALYLESLEIAATYKKAAESSGNMKLSGMYTKFAGDEYVGAELLEALIQQALK